MKDISGAIVLFFILLFAYTKLAGPLPFSINSVTTTKTDTFTVHGEGKVTMIPDIAVVSLGVSAQGTSVSKVQDELNTKMNAISGAIKKLGVDAKDIKTSYYHISPMYDYASSTRRVTGYQASSNLTVKVRKIDTANSVIDAATREGANEVGGVSFDVDDKTKAENQAREAAVADAKAKASAAAKAAGFTLGRVINYSEGNGASPRPLMYDTAEKAMPISGGGAPTEVEPGTSELSVNVSVSYEIQ
jgi:uncharacterized protein YggE